MNLSEKNQKVVEYFYSLKKEIDSNLNHNLTNQTHIQKYLYFTVGPVFNYTEAIIILCKEKKFNAALSLLRSLFETHINIQYYTSDNNDKKLAIAAKKVFDSRLAVVNAFKKLVKDYPNFLSNDSSSLYNKDYQDKTLEEINKDRSAIIKKYNLTDQDKDPKLIKKTKLCDTAKIPDAEPGHFELMYHLVYRQLSPFVHLDIEGIDHFINKDQSGNYFVTEKPNEDLLISQSINICVALVKDLYDNKVINSDRSENIKLIDNILSSR
jgi:hypothetical protein